jgi:hypothetical protein
VTSTNFVLDGGSDQRMTRSTSPLVDLAADWTVYAKIKIVSYGSWGTIFGAIENLSNFAHVAEWSAAGDLHIARQGPGIDYDETSVWTDGYTGWFDFLAICSGGTVQVYYRRDGESWVTSASQAMPNVAEAQIYAGMADLAAPGNGTFRLAKYAIWNTALSEATGKAEASARALGTSTSCIFFNQCSGTSPHSDASGNGNDWTLVGSPSSNADDPWPTGITGTCAIDTQPFATSSTGTTGTAGITGTCSIAVQPFAAAASGLVNLYAPMPWPQPMAFGYPWRRPIPGLPTFGRGILAPPAIVPVVGNAIAALSSFGVTATGLVTLAGSASIALSPFALPASGLETFAGAASAAVNPFATNSAGAETFSGSTSIACSPFAVAGNGAQETIFTGACSISLQGFAVTAAGAETFSGAASVACSSFAIASSGGELFSATCAVAVQPFAVSGLSGVGGGIVGTCTAALSPFNLASSATETFTGSGSCTCSPFGVAGAGGETFNCAGAIALAPFAVTADGLTGAGGFFGVAAIALPPFSASSSGSEAFAGSALIECSRFGVLGAQSPVNTLPAVAIGFRIALDDLVTFKGGEE